MFKLEVSRECPIKQYHLDSEYATHEEAVIAAYELLLETVKWAAPGRMWYSGYHWDKGSLYMHQDRDASTEVTPMTDTDYTCICTISEELNHD